MEVLISYRVKKSKFKTLSVTIVWDGGGERSQKWNSDVLVFGRMELYLELNCIFYSNIMYTKNYIRQL